MNTNDTETKEEAEELDASIVEEFLSGDEGLLSEEGGHPLQVLQQLRPLVDELIRKNRELEREVRQKNRLKVLGEMASCLAHEVRTPLSSVRLNLERLQKKLSVGEEEEELMSKVDQGLSRVQNIVEDILTYSREIDPIMVRFSWNGMIEDVFDQLEAIFHRYDSDVKRAFADELPYAHGDREKISRVHENVIRNAIQAAGDEGTVTIQTRLISKDDEEERYFETVVLDDGPGIPEEIQEKLFVPFHSKKTRGTGLGLAISHRIVKAHDGEISGENREDGGARFTIRIPVTNQQSE